MGCWPGAPAPTASCFKRGCSMSRQDTPRTLTLAADAGLASGRELVVTLGCQAPD
ncbi:DUF2195 family protein [Pseudomonas aeruginosa]|nr:DUF2195 family protein [Pseudomonas aeruginosa]